MRLHYTMPSGINESNRAHLDRLHRSMHGPFSASDAADVLNLTVPRTRRLLSWLENQGWLTRIKRGLYVVVPLGAKEPTEWRADPWIIAAKVFAPCYIGGWSACEHWSLTEQVFRGVVVISANSVRSPEVEVQGTPFIVRERRLETHFGTTVVWREGVKIAVSDPSRTIVDILDDPSIGGGIQHVRDVVSGYFESRHRNDSVLLEYAQRLGNRSVFKRLGYLIETDGIDAAEVASHCQQEKSSGVTLLDPEVRAAGRIVSRWNLRINVRLHGESPS